MGGVLLPLNVLSVFSVSSFVYAIQCFSLVVFNKQHKRKMVWRPLLIASTWAFSRTPVCRPPQLQQSAHFLTVVACKEGSSLRAHGSLLSAL